MSLGSILTRSCSANSNSEGISSFYEFLEKRWLKIIACINSTYRNYPPASGWFSNKSWFTWPWSFSYSETNQKLVNSSCFSTLVRSILATTRDAIRLNANWSVLRASLKECGILFNYVDVRTLTSLRESA